jgi:uncharacterized protein
MAHNALNWFEIPVSDMDRAKKFYGHIFPQSEFHTEDMGEIQMAYFPSDQDSASVGGALAKSENHKPAMDGSVVYLNAAPSIDEHMTRAQEAGGQVVLEKTPIRDGEMGYFSLFIDSEGNKVGFHSMH